LRSDAASRQSGCPRRSAICVHRYRICVFFLMAFAYALEHLETRRTAPLMLAGICCGVVAGTKILGAVAGNLLSLSCSWHSKRETLNDGRRQFARELIEMQSERPEFFRLHGVERDRIASQHHVVLDAP